MIFRLVRHKKYGPGVVLSKQDRVLDIYFADKQKRSILDSSVYFIEDKVNLDEFIRCELYEGIFDKFTKEKAKSYINKEHINRLSFQGNKITGIVNGTNQYFVSLQTKNNQIEIMCTCPVKSLCKHEYAFFRMLKETNYAEDKKETVVKKQKLLESAVLSLYKLGNFASLDNFIDVVDYLLPCKKELFQEYILIFLKNKSPHFDDLVFYAISPLFFNENFKEILLSLADDKNLSVTNLINKAYQLFLNDYVNPSRKFNRLATILNAVVCLDISKLLSVEKTVYMPSDFVETVLFYLLRKKEYTANELYEIANSSAFIHMDFYYSKSDINSIGKNKLAFIRWFPISDAVFDGFNINDLIQFLSILKMNSELILYLNKNFEKIDPKNYQLLVNKLYFCRSSARSNDKILDIIGKLPHSMFLFDLFERDVFDRF